jgi:hypothetical protein
VQSYLRQKRATGAQVTPQNERAAWSGYYDTMAQNSLAERASAMQQERLDILRDEQKAAEGAATWSGVGQLISTAGIGATLLKGTSLGARIGLGTATTSPGAAPAGAATPGAGAGPVTAALSTPGSGASEAALAGGMTAAQAESVAPAVASETGLLSAATPYLGPAGVGFAAGSMVPNMLGFNKGKGELAAGAVSGGVAGGIAGGFMLGAAGTSWSGPGAIVGGIIGAVAGGVGAKVK